MVSGLDKTAITILVLVKAVSLPDDASGVQMNRFDEYAVEEALQLKKNLPGVSVHVMSLGPDRVDRVIKRALGMGADAAIHVRTPDNETPSSALTAKQAAAAIDHGKYDLILTGIMSQDRMEGQVGPMLAEHLGMPCVVGVVSTDMNLKNGRILVEREMEAGLRDCLSIRLPALMAVQAGINKPRYPTLSNMLAAGKKQVHSVSAAELPGAPFDDNQLILDFLLPEKTRAGIVLQGSCQDKAGKVFQRLREKGVV